MDQCSGRYMMCEMWTYSQDKAFLFRIKIQNIATLLLCTVRKSASLCSLRS